MASQEDDNKLENKSNVNNDQERNFINVYKQFEYVLRSKCEEFPKKIQSLIEVWKSLGECKTQNCEIGYIIQIMDWAKLHTLNIVLTATWKKFKTTYEATLLTEVENTQRELIKISDVFSKKFQKLSDVIKNPWDDPILANLLHDSNAKIGPEEIEFFCVETAYLVSVRLKKLCESRCEDLALNLVAAFMRCYELSQKEKFSLNATKIHILFCFDVHIALLHRYKRNSEIVDMFKKLSLDDGLQLVRRFTKKRVKISKIWRHYQEITFLASQVFVTAAVTKPVSESGVILKELLYTWIVFSEEHSLLDQLETSIRKIIQAATASTHIYLCCEKIYNKLGANLKTFTIELYIRALTTDMNNLESQKTEEDKEKVDETTKRLANGFCNLCDVLKDNIQVSRECALTAFSLDPTLERLRKIEDLAKLSGIEVLDTGQIWECKLHPPVTAADEISWVCNACGKWMSKPNLDLHLSTNFALNEALNFETLGISSQLCDDLAVVLNGPRYHLLSWLLRWTDLHRLCEMYLNDVERTKNLVTELKFVEIDYSMFVTVKREPVEENSGIEKGYESYLYPDEKEEEEELKVVEPVPPEIPQPKSDPNTLKTLRMFRHNLKRNRPQNSPTPIASSSNDNGHTSSSFSEQLKNLNFLQHYQRLPNHPFTQAIFNQPAAGSFSPYKTPSDEPVDFSARSSQIHNLPTSSRDYKINIQKRKSDCVETSEQKCLNYMNSDNNFLHNVIKQEFLRSSADSKRCRLDNLSSTSLGPNAQSSIERYRSEEPINYIMPDRSRVKSDSVSITSVNKMQSTPSKNIKTEPGTSTSESTISRLKRNLLEQTKARLFHKNFDSSRSLLREKLTNPIQETESEKKPVLPILKNLISGNSAGVIKYPNSRISQLPPVPRNDEHSSYQTAPKQQKPRSNIRLNPCEAVKPPAKNLQSLIDRLTKKHPINKPPIPDFIKRLNDSPKKGEQVKEKKAPQIFNGVIKKDLAAIISSSIPHKKIFEYDEQDVMSPSKGFPSFDKIPPPPVMGVSKDLELKREMQILKEAETVKKETVLREVHIPREAQFSREMWNSSPSSNNGNVYGTGCGVKAEADVQRPQELQHRRGVSILQQTLCPSQDVNLLKAKPPAHVDCAPQRDVAVNGNCSGKDENIFLDHPPLAANSEVNLKRLSDVERSGEVPIKKLKIEEVATDFESKIDELILERTDVVQNENSSKNANCCLPPTKIDDAAKKIDISKIIVSNGKSKNQKVDGKKDSMQADAKNIGATKKSYSSDNSKNLLLRTLSEQHIPLIVEGERREIKTDTMKECGDEAQTRRNNAQEETDIGKPNSPKRSRDPNAIRKELKIILYRLSDSIIRSFIPTHKPLNEDDCTCNLQKQCDKPKKIGRPRKPIKCKYHKNSTDDVAPSKTLKRLRSAKLYGISCNNPKEDISDIPKKTGTNKIVKNYDKNKKSLDVDSDKQKKPKKEYSDRSRKNGIPLKKCREATNKNESIMQNSNMNPRVILERLPLDSSYVRSVLSNVPGLNDFEMIRPSNVDHIVNVVQISGGRSTTSVPVQNTQTSTQITPHIQRIGQPRSDKPEHNVNSETNPTVSSASTSTTIKPSTSQPSTLINILSQQIIRPGQSNCVRNRSSPLINILSQQIIRPATNPVKTTTNAGQGEITTSSSITEPVNQVEKPTASTTKAPPAGQGTILQFICKSTLPKFQQAFGKTVYQNSDGTEAVTTAPEPTTAVDVKKVVPKNSSVNIQPIQGGVIYTRQMPVGQAINLIPPGRGQVFRIATSNPEQISLVKDTVIHSKMSALLAAALQGKKTSESQSDGEAGNDDGVVTVTRPTLVQNARIVKPVLQIPSNVIRTSPQSNLSSTTLEQLREFDMVYKQIKERSSTSTPSEANTSDSNEPSQRISVTYLNQQGQKYTQLSPVVVVSSYCNLQPAASPALSVTSQGSSSPCVTPAPTPSATKVSSKSSKGKTVKNTTTQASKASPVPKPQQKPQEDEHTTQRIFDILAEYAEQLRNSPDLNNKPAPRRRSNPPTNPSQNSKRKKNSSSKKSGQCSSMVSDADIEDHRTVGSEDSSCGVVQISMQDDEQPLQSIASESNDSTSGSKQQFILTDAGNNQTRNLIIADSSVGEALKMPNTAVLVPGNYIMPVSMVKGGQQIAVVSGGSKILATVPARSGPNMLLFQSFLNQNRNKSGVPTVKYSTIQPISGISSQSLAGVSGQPPVILPPNSHNLTAVSLGQPLTLKKIEDVDRVNTELLLTIAQPKDNGSSSGDSSVHPDSTNNTVSSNMANMELEETIAHSENSSEKVYSFQKTGDATPIAIPVIAQTSCVKEDSASEQATNSGTIGNKNESSKSMERVQSVLVTACTSNGPMLSHPPSRYRKPSESTGTNNETSNKEDFLHNGEKQNNNDQKHGNATYYPNKSKKSGQTPRLDREIHQLSLQRKQAALERELRLQKSLSEECEDLGVDEPSTSDLFPEADILFDSNHSPSFDQSSQDLVKRPLPQDIKEENKTGMTLFSDDDNSTTLRTDFLFESVEYQSTGTELVYGQNQQLTNGQSSTSNESRSSCGEDHTLLQTCASMSDVTLNSPVSPDPYQGNTPPALNKYKYKYSNRRKGERHHKHTAEAWTGEVSSSEDTTGSTELGNKSASHSPESCTNKRSHSVSCDDELSDGSYKVVRVAISKSDLLKDDESCEELHCDDDLECSLSGRGARRSVKKTCCCCNGSQEGGGASRKRPSSRPHTPVPHKKAFLNKKR